MNILLSCIFSVAVLDLVLSLSPREAKILYNSGKYDQLSRSLGVDEELIKPGGSNTVTIHNMLEKSFEELDILLTPRQKQEREDNPMFTISSGERWATREVPYYILESSFNSSDPVSEVERAIQEFNDAVKSVQFRHWKRSDTDCVLIYKGNKLFSNIGHVGGLQSISLVSLKGIPTGLIKHFLMHTVGMAHEVNRPDRDKYIHVYFDQTDKLPKEYYQVFYQHDPLKSQYLGRYDYYSIMHFSTDLRGSVKKAYKILQLGIDEKMVGAYTNLTSTDVDKVNAFYTM